MTSGVPACYAMRAAPGRVWLKGSLPGHWVCSEVALRGGRAESLAGAEVVEQVGEEPVSSTFMVPVEFAVSGKEVELRTVSFSWLAICLLVGFCELASIVGRRVVVGDGTGEVVVDKDYNASARVKRDTIR